MDEGRPLQSPPDPPRFHYVTVTVRVHDYPDGTLAVFPGPRGLARYQPDGRVIESKGAHPSRRHPTRGSDDRPIVDPRPIAHKTVSARG